MRFWRLRPLLAISTLHLLIVTTPALGRVFAHLEEGASDSRAQAVATGLEDAAWNEAARPANPLEPPSGARVAQSAPSTSEQGSSSASPDPDSATSRSTTSTPAAPAPAPKSPSSPLPGAGPSASFPGRASPRAKVEWKYLGLSIRPLIPRLVSLVAVREHHVAASYEPGEGATTAPTVIYDARVGRPIKRIREPVPLTLQDARGNLSGLTSKGDPMQLVVHLEEKDGSIGTRIVRIPPPSGPIATQPYLLSPAHFAPDGALILVSANRDRFYRINLALGEAKAILPLQPLHIVDFDINAAGELLVLDGYEQELVWVAQDGEVLEQIPLTRSEGKEPGHYHLSVAAGPERSAWVGVAVRQDDGSFMAEVQRIQGKLRERQQLGGGTSGLGLPLELAGDRQGGVFVADEHNRVFHISASTQLLRAWEARAPSTMTGTVVLVRPEGGTDGSSSGMRSGASEGEALQIPSVDPTQRGEPIFLAESGSPLPGLGATMDAALPALTLCYDRLRQVSPSASGDYRLELTTRDRNIQGVEVYQKNFDDFGLESCVSQVLRGVRFPARVGHQTLRIDLTFNLPARP